LNVATNATAALTAAIDAVALQDFSMPFFIARSFRSILIACLLLTVHRYLHLAIGPTAVIAEVPGVFAGTIVHNQLKNVVAGLTEACLRRSLSVHDLSFGRIEHYLAGSPVFGPCEGHPNRLSVPNGAPIVLCFQRKLQRRGSSGVSGRRQRDIRRKV